MKLLAAVLTAAASAVVVAAEGVIDFTKLPSCANECTTLKNADSSCVPPQAPVTDQATYQSCVCQSSLLSSFSSGSASAVCQACSAGDATAIASYYNSLCKGGVVVTPSATTSSTAPATATSSTSTSTSTNTADGSSGTAAMSSKKTTWWSTHYKWVIMVIVIALAIVILWVGGVLLRRRHNRKKDAERANVAAADAPYTPGTPDARSTLTKNTPPEMSTAGGRGVVPATPVRTMTGRSRSGTLSSMRLGNSSRTQVSEPVVWGPHQHFAHTQQAYGNGNGNPTGSTPSVNVTPPNPVFRNQNAILSEPRFGQFRATPSSLAVESTPGGHSPAASSSSGETITRPATAMGHETASYGDLRAKRRTLSAVKSDPNLHEPQSAEICEPSPQKTPNKLQKH